MCAQGASEFEHPEEKVSRQVFEKETELRKEQEGKRKEVQTKLEVAEAELERLVRYVDEIINRPEVPLPSLTVSLFT